MLSPVSLASCSLMWRVGLGVWLNAVFRTSSCFALMVVLGPLLLPPGIQCMSDCEDVRWWQSHLTRTVRAPVLLLELVPIRRMQGVSAILVVVCVLPLLCLDLGHQPQGPGPGLQHVVVVLHLDAGQTQARAGGWAVRGPGKRAGGGQGAGRSRGLQGAAQGDLLVIIIILVRKEKIWTWNKVLLFIHESISAKSSSRLDTRLCPCCN